MKAIHSILFASILCAPVSLMAQTFPQTYGGWCHGGTGSDHFRAMCQTTDFGIGGYYPIYYAGATNSKDGDIVDSKNANFSSDFLVYDPGANVPARYKTFGGSGHDIATGIAAFKTMIGVVGVTNSTDGNIGVAKASDDVGILSLQRDNAPGQSYDTLVKIWSKTYGGSGIDYGHDVVFTSDSALVFAAATNSNDMDVSYNHGDFDIWLVKLNRTGDIVWEKTYGGSLYDRPLALRKTKDNGFVIAGLTTSADHDVSLNHGMQDVWIIKLDGSGNIEWEKTYGGTKDDEVTSIEETPDGGYIVAATTESSNGDVSFNHGNRDAWVIKIDASGDIQWQKTYGGTDDEYTPIVKPNINNNVLTGYFFVTDTRSDDGDVTDHYSNTPYRNMDIWTSFLDTSGAIVWSKCLGGTKDEWVFDAELRTHGHLLITGSTHSSDGNMANFHASPIGSSPDAFTINIIHEVNSVKNIASTNAKVYPTLTNGVVNIQFKELQDNTEMIITDITGKPLHHTKANEKLQQLDISNYPPGNYLLTITNKHGREVHRLTKM